MNIAVLADYQPPPNLLKNRIIFVTGAGDGIGKAAALAFAQSGATVILAGRTVAKLEAVYDLIEQAGYPQASISPLDIEGATESDYEVLGDALLSQFGHLDGLLHNAGELGERTPLANYKLSTWQKVMQVNVSGQFILTKALLPVLTQSTDASIVFTSSSVGRKGRAFWGAYAISKFATEGMVQVWADELEEISTLRVNAINPGATRTLMRANAFPAEDPRTLKKPEDIMSGYLYLMGPDSNGVTGKSFNAQI